MLVSTRSTETLSLQTVDHPGDLLDRVELARLAVAKRLDPERKTSLGQFFTPMPVARLMAWMPAPVSAHFLPPASPNCVLERTPRRPFTLLPTRSNRR